MSKQKWKLGTIFKITRMWEKPKYVILIEYIDDRDPLPYQCYSISQSGVIFEFNEHEVGTKDRTYTIEPI